MVDSLLLAVGYGGYISIIKFVVFLVLFFLWLMLLTWVYKDAEAIETNYQLWTAVVFGAGAAGSIVFLLAPAFTVGLVFYLIAVAVVAIAYIAHRNSKVLEYDRVLTFKHIKSLVSASEQKKLENLKNFLFITANNNEIPMPRPKTPEFFGYRVAYDLFADANWRRASNVALSPMYEKYSVTYFIDGAATKQPSVTKEQMEYFIHFIKSLADLNIKEKRKPQKGHLRIRQDNQDTEWEVTTAGSTAGEQVRLKKVTEDDTIRVAELGLMPEQIEELDKVVAAKQGIFIVSGRPKTGVTTTFYAFLRHHDSYLNIIETLETQPTADLPNITQIQFSPTDNDAATFATKLRSITRMGPDIVGIAGCNDTETAKLACQEAKEGKLIYITLQAKNAVQAIGKWIKLVADNELAFDTLAGISSQRLMRKLCEECKQAYGPNKELLRKFNIPPEKAKVLYRPGREQFDKHGKATMCPHCQGTGYVGRTGVFQIVTLDDQLRDAVKQSKSLADIGTQFRRAKMLYLQEQAMRKVITGTTAINEMIRIFAAPKKRKRK